MRLEKYTSRVRVQLVEYPKGYASTTKGSKCDTFYIYDATLPEVKKAIEDVCEPYLKVSRQRRSWFSKPTIKIFKCKKCGYETTNSRALGGHMTSHIKRKK